jgi:hypothetical protein
MDGHIGILPASEYVFTFLGSTFKAHRCFPTNSTFSALSVPAPAPPGYASPHSYIANDPILIEEMRDLTNVR